VLSSHCLTHPGCEHDLTTTLLSVKIRFSFHTYLARVRTPDDLHESVCEEVARKYVERRHYHFGYAYAILSKEYNYASVTILKMPKFIPGLKLCELFYQNRVRPILNEEFPNLRYSAAVIGWGSEVLEFDTAISRDHHWGPRLLLFLTPQGYSKLNHKICQSLSNKLPYEFMGYSTSFSKPKPNGVRHAVKITRRPVNHMVQIFTLKSFFETRLKFDPSKKIEVTDWLTFPQQRLLELVSGKVYYDGLGQLRKIRTKLEFYPRDVWLYLLAAQWTKISQEEAFVGRTGDVGDELGSQVVAAHLVREIMKLAFLMERHYTPYSKWLGTAFGKLEISNKLTPVLRNVLLAKTWKTRERKLGQAYSIVARRHNALKITKPLPTKVTKYYGRPYLVIHGDAFASCIREAIRDPRVKSITPNVGSIDQFIDSTDVLQQLSVVRRLGVVYKQLDDN